MGLPGKTALVCIATAMGTLGCTGSDTGDTGVPQNTQWAEDPLWDLEAPPTFRVELPVDDWEATLWDLAPEEDCEDRAYLEGSVTFINPVDGSQEVVEQVGVRWRGQSALDISDPTIERVDQAQLQRVCVRAGVPGVPEDQPHGHGGRLQPHAGAPRSARWS